MNKLKQIYIRGNWDSWELYVVWGKKEMDMDEVTTGANGLALYCS